MVKQMLIKNKNILVGELKASDLEEVLSQRYKNAKKIIFVDENTQEKCLPVLLSNFKDLKGAEIICLPLGEENKDLAVCNQVWEAMLNYHIQRQDLIINLGGGVVTDMGGFIASVYQRGVDFINIPTSLLGMVDASIGGKTGVNLLGFKNQLGVFSSPFKTYCDLSFLATLPAEEILSGKAEMLKHGLIFSKKLWESLKIVENKIPKQEIIEEAIGIKVKIVNRDFEEKGERKKLNYGHTVGHSIESYLLSRGEKVKHGECVAWGMLVESYLSKAIAGLSAKEGEEIENVIRSSYSPLPIEESDFTSLIKNMKKDKKNKGAINFTLLKEIGRAEVDYTPEIKEIEQALRDVFG